jgi:hypothetical protein
MNRSSSSSPFYELLDMLDTNQADFSQERDAVHFDMYVKIRELKQIGDGLRKIIALPEADKKVWIKDNESYLAEMMESVLQDTLSTIDGMQLDSEGLELSVQLVSTMRDTMDVMQSIMRRSRTS